MQTRKQRLTAIEGAIVLVLGVLLLVQSFTEINAWVWVAALALLGCLSFTAWLGDRSQWGWLLMPYVLWAIALLIALIHLDALQGDYVAVFVLLVIALPFLGVYARRRRQWWALIPAYTLAAVALMLLLTAVDLLDDELVAAYVLFAIALPFCVVYLRNRRQWWWLIPAGILTIIGFAFLIASGAGIYIAGVLLLAVGAWILVRGLRGRRRSPRVAPAGWEAPEPGGEEEEQEEGPPLV